MYHRMNEGFKEKALFWLTLGALAAVLAGGATMIYPNYCRSQSLKRQNAELQQRIDRKKRDIAKLVENKRRFRTDADFVEMIARQNHRVFPGELVFIFDKE